MSIYILFLLKVLFICQKERSCICKMNILFLKSSLWDGVAWATGSRPRLLEAFASLSGHQGASQTTFSPLQLSAAVGWEREDGR